MGAMRYSLPIRIARPAKLFSDMAIMVNRRPKFEPTPWSAKLWMLNRLDTGILGLATDGFDVAAQLPAWRGAPAAPRGDAHPKFDP
jgi:hypothetical protein